MPLTFSKTRRRRRTLPIVLIAGAIAVVGARYALGQGDTLDTDGDGMVSYTELLMALPEVTQSAFQALDTDGDGRLDAEELTAARDAGVLRLD